MACSFSHHFFLAGLIEILFAQIPKYDERLEK
jgi:hypothetical protein